MKGWWLIDLSERSRHVLDSAVVELQSMLGCLFSDYVEDDKRHIKTQSMLAERFISGGYGREIIAASLPQFQNLLGLDLHIQRYPYLRIARPGKPQDNIGIHRDTLYGGTPYEVSVVIPLTEMPAEGSLHVVDHSNTAPESDYPFERVDTDVVKQSAKHKLGFLYQEKRLGAVNSRPVVVRYGQALAFPLSLVHGQDVNNATFPRFSVDIRLVNSLAPITWTHTVRADYWEPLCSTPITQQARAYYANQ